MIAIRLRFAALWVARVFSRSVAAVTAGSSRLVVPLFGRHHRYLAREAGHRQRTERVLDSVLTAALYLLLVYVAAALLRWVRRTRRLTTSKKFVEYQTGHELTPLTQALSVRVPVEFNRLQRLNGPVKETDVASSRVKEESYQSLRVTVKAETVSTFLQSAVSAETTVGIGIFKVPLQAASRFAGRFMQGPRITGSVMRSSDGILIVAQMVGGDRNESWQVRAQTNAAGEASSTDDVARELACRIFTTLGRAGRSTWRATADFCDAMEAYRRYTIAASNERRKFYLTGAERSFLDTLAADVLYDHAYYNLGIVYMRLERFDAAQQALLRAITHDPSDAAPYHALARIRYFVLEKPERAIELAERVTSTASDTAEKARAYDLKGLAERRLDRLEEAKVSRRKAVALAWRSLLVAELKTRRRNQGRENEFERELLSTCCRNLAVAYAYDAVSRLEDSRAGRLSRSRRLRNSVRSTRSFRRCELLLTKALTLTRSQADVYFQLGKIYVAWGRVDRGCRQLEQASRADPANAEFAAYLASARAMVWSAAPSEELWHRVQDACQLALETPSKVLSYPERGEAILIEVADAYEAIGEADRAERVRTMPQVFDAINSADSDSAALSALAQRFAEEGRDWASARVHYKLGVITSEDDARLHEARDYFQRAMKELEAHPGEVRALGIRAELAAVDRRQQLYGEALKEANSAVDLDPFTSYERGVLGQIHADSGEHAKSRDAFEAALLLSPDDPSFRSSAGLACWNLASGLHGTERTSSLRAAVAHFEEALDLEDAEGRLQTHYWLGRLRAELGDYENAIRHFRTAMNFDPAETLARLHLAYCFLEVESYDDAAAAFRQLITGDAPVAANGRRRLGVELGDPYSLAAVLGWSYQGLAVTFLNRDVYLDVALTYLTRAHDIARLADKDEQIPLRAACASSKGQLLLKLGETDRAIRALEHAAWLFSDAETHFNLALAYERQLHDARTRPSSGTCCDVRRHTPASPGGRWRDGSSTRFRDSSRHSSAALDALQPEASPLSNTEKD